MKKYIFNSRVINKLGKFKKYLQEKKYAENTILQKLNYAGIFLQFIENENLTTNEIRYADMLAFIDGQTSENKSKQLINSILLSVRNYFEYLKIQNPKLINPAKDLKIKGIRKKIPRNILEFSFLEKIYNDFKTKNYRSKRNKIIFGLFVYQAITTEELQKLRPGYLKLKKGKIIIPGSKKTAGRTLNLEASQILELHEYIEKIRPLIIKEINKKRPSRKPNEIDSEQLEEQLFISINGSAKLKSSIYHLFREIKKKYPEIQNAKQIRRSIIIYKLKTGNLREVQYFAGHKYVSSTEKYLINNIENLKKETEKYHPLND